MNAKLIPAALFAIVAGFSGCDGNDDPATDVKVDTGSPDGDATTSPDIEVVPQPDVTQGDGSVKAAQTEAASVTCDPAGFVDVNPATSLKDVVVTTAKFDASPAAAPASIDGYYVADQNGGAYSGIVVRVPAAARPAAELVPGDVIDVTGQLTEVFCLTQLEAVSVTKKGTATPPAAVSVASAADAGNEAYESMLVKVSGVTIEAASANGGSKLAGSDVAVGFDLSVGFVDLKVGGKYDITGIMGYEFSKWTIQPRGPTDITVIELPPSDTVSISSLQDSTISKTCATPAPNFVNGLNDVTIEGVALVGNYGSNADQIIVSDGTQSTYSAIQVRFPAGSITVAPGDNVKAVGDHVEYYCLTQLNNATVTKTAGTLTAPGPLVVDKATTDLEPYEGMLVEMNNVQIIADDTHGAGTTDGVFLVDKTIMGSAFDLPSLTGKTLATLRGVVFYSFDKFRVSPRSAADLVVAP